MDSTAQIAGYVGQLLSEKGVLLGSQLGYAIKKRFPEFTLRPKYHGIRDFIDRECSEQVIVVGVSGQDIKFGTRGDSTSETHTPVSIKVRAKKSPWVVFSNPSIDGNITIDPQSGDLSVVQDPAAVTSPRKIVPGLTEGDNRRLCMQFVKELSDPVTAPWEAILEKPNFWREWATAVENFEAGRFQARWMKFRRDAIEREFCSRLEELGIPQILQEKAVRNLRQTRAPIRSDRLDNFADQSSQRTGLVSLKRVAQAAVELMSDDEIRKLNIPLGVMFDAISKSKR